MKNSVHAYLLPVVALAMTSDILAQTAEAKLKLTGDLGVGLFHQKSIVGSVPDTSIPIPYAYADYGRLFCRLDTFGVKTVAVGCGHLEVLGRISADGYDTNNAVLKGLNSRKDSSLWGVGSFQTTPYGALAIYGFHDFNRSQGNLAELSYLASIPFGKLTVFPVFGCALQDTMYNRYYYGVSGTEYKNSGFSAYSPHESLNAFVSITVDIPLYRRLHLNFTAQEKFLSSAVTRSPIINKTSQATYLLSIVYRFN